MHPAFEQHLRDCEYLDRETERDLIARAQAGCKDSMERVVRSVLRLVVRVATKYRRFVNNDHELAMSCALVTLMNCIRTFDASKNCRLATVAGNAIYFELMKERFNFAAVHIPHVAARHPATVEKAKRAMQAAGDVYQRDNEPHYTPALDPVDVDELRRELSAAMIWLDSREQEILTRRMDGETLREIGGSMELSKERVRQLEERAIKKLRQHVKAA